jgi:hypothetical protein
VLTLVSAADGQPLPGAAIVMGGRTLTGDAAGRVTLDAALADFTFVDVIGAGHFDRNTAVRSSEGTRLTLWPKESAEGLSEQTTAELVYTPGARCCPAERLGGDVLARVDPAITSFTLVVDAEYRGFARTMTAIRDAAALATAAAGGRVTFAVGEGTAGARIAVTTGEYPDGTPAAAFADRTFNASGYITGGSIVIVDRTFLTEGRTQTDTVKLYAHEIGHMLGLEHSTAPGVMAVVDGVSIGFFYFRANGDYSPTEKLVLRLMTERRAGNRFPDNDRTAAARSLQQRQRIVCGG